MDGGKSGGKLVAGSHGGDGKGRMGWLVWTRTGLLDSVVGDGKGTGGGQRSTATKNGFSDGEGHGRESGSSGRDGLS